ncbi:MAG: ATP-dependent metallopeptidase FtsH/Yme1/Tma family protein, partial [Patescibacteria group bacterium]
MAKEKRFQFKLKVNLWTILLGFFVLLFILPLFFSAVDMKGSSEKVEISRALADIKEDKVEKIMVENERIILTYKSGEVKYAVKEENESLSDLLDKADIDPTKVNYSVIDQSLTKVFGEILSIVLPLGLMAAFFFFILRAQNRGAQDIFSFGRSR